MRLTQSVQLGVWLLISLNLLMALGSIWVFIRMAPAIEVIIEQNEHSLQACESMLASLSMVDCKESDIRSYKKTFENALENARNNITETEEPLALELIKQSYSEAFEKNAEARKQTLDAILFLSGINRNAMVAADVKARQFGNAGAWGIVFMAIAVFLIEMLFIRGLKRNLLEPLEEIQSVVSAHRSGDRMRRCTGTDLPKDIKNIFNDLNIFFDKEASASNREI